MYQRKGRSIEFNYSLESMADADGRLTYLGVHGEFYETIPIPAIGCEYCTLGGSISIECVHDKPEKATQQYFESIRPLCRV